MNCFKQIQVFTNVAGFQSKVLVFDFMNYLCRFIVTNLVVIWIDSRMFCCQGQLLQGFAKQSIPAEPCIREARKQCQACWEMILHEGRPLWGLQVDSFVFSACSWSSVHLQCPEQHSPNVYSVWMWTPSTLRTHNKREKHFHGSWMELVTRADVEV